MNYNINSNSNIDSPTGGVDNAVIVPPQLIRSVCRALETNRTCKWRVQVSISKFYIIVEDVLDAALHSNILHLHCLSQEGFDCALQSIRYDLQGVQQDLDAADNIIDNLNLDIAELEETIRLLKLERSEPESPSPAPESPSPAYIEIEEWNKILHPDRYK